MASLKEGSQYEDVALVMALHKLVAVSHEMRLQVRETVIALGHFGKEKEALILQVRILLTSSRPEQNNCSNGNSAAVFPSLLRNVT